MYPTILTLHIVFGVTSMIFCIGGVYAATTNKAYKYSFYKKSIWILTGFETVSGVFVVALDPVSFIRFCVSLGFYLAMIFAVQLLLFYKSRKIFASSRA